MTNLSDLFPAGAGKQVSFTASGNVTSSGKPVVLNSDGTVSEVSGSAAVVGSTTQLLATMQATPAISVIGGSQAVVMGDKYLGGGGGTTNSLEGFVLTGSGSTITKSSEQQLSGNTNYSICSCYDSVNDKVVVAWMEFSNPNRNHKIAVGTVSGTGAGASISWGATTDWATHTTYTSWDKIVYDPDTGNFCILYYNNTTYLLAHCGTVSGTSVTMGSTPVTVMSALVNWLGLAYDPDTQRMIMVYESGGTTYSRVATMTGANATASVTLGSQETAVSAKGEDLLPVYDPDNDKMCLVYRNQADDTLKVTVGTVTGGGTNSITWASPVTVQDNSDAGAGTLGPTYDSVGADYDTNLNQIVVCWRQTGSPYYSYMQGVTITGTTPSAGDNTVVMSYNSQNKAIAYDSTLQKTFYAGSGNGDLTSLLMAPGSTNLTSTNFLGISDAAISSAASGNITIKGGIAATGLSSLTPASDYYVQDDGTITTVSSDVKAGKALSATAINLEYTS